MAKYFTIEEMCISASYPKLVVVPQKGTIIYNNWERLMGELDKVRETYGKPIIVTSGYRPPLLNAKVGGSATSMHRYGLAADVKSKSSQKDNVNILRTAIESDIPYDQLIAEKATFKGGVLESMQWLHVGLSQGKARRQLLYFDGKGYYPLKMVKNSDGEITFKK